MDEQPTKLDKYESAFLANNRIMAQILTIMRDEPLLPIAQADDIYPLVKVDFPYQGGMLSHLEGMSEPFRGFPYAEFVDVIDKLKKLGRGLLSGFYHLVWKKTNKLKLLSLLPAFWMFRKLLKATLYSTHRVIQRYKIKPNKHCQCVRELYRVFNLEMEEDTSIESLELKAQIRDILCMILEFDNAYRFRFQDIMTEFDKKNFLKKPLKEFKRLFGLLIEREKVQEVKDTWFLFKMILNYLRFNKQLRKIIVDVFSILNIEELKFTKEDLPYCKGRKDYNFGFIIKK